MASRRYQVTITLLLIAAAVFSRLVPHPANFTAITAIALFGGAILPRKLAVSLPLATMIISDLFLGVHDLIFFTWGLFALIALGAYFWLRQKRNPVKIMASAFIGSLIFYLVTNAAVWAQGQLYPVTFDGLIQAYIAGIPFFRNMLIGDQIFTLTIFGLYWLANKSMLPIQQDHSA